MANDINIEEINNETSNFDNINSDIVDTNDYSEWSDISEVYIDTNDYNNTDAFIDSPIDKDNIQHNNKSKKDEEFDIDSDTDINYEKIDSVTKWKLAKKQKENAELANISNISDIDIEKAVLYILLTWYNTNIIDAISNFNIKQEFFVSELWNKIFNLMYNIGASAKVDYLILKDAFEKESKNDKEKQAFKQFFNFQWFIPKKDFFEEYNDMLTSNFNRNWLNNLILNLEKAIKDKDDDKIKYLKYEIENFQLHQKDDTNPDLWLVTNEYLSRQATEWTNWAWKTSKQVLKTWFSLFDNKIGGFEKWQFIVFAARPSVWKSIALINTMYSMCNQGAYGLYVSAEMYAKYIYSRWTSIDLEINNNKIKSPSKLSEKEKKKVLAFHEKFKNIKNARFFFDNVVTARDIELVARKIKAENNGQLDVIFIDYLWKLYPNSLNMNRSRNDIVTDISKELFELAGKLDVVIVTASQLSRASSKDADQDSLVVPKMSDIRDSWAIEQDADLIIWITRDKVAWMECYTEDQKTDFNWHLIKNRNGELWDFVFDFHPTIQKLVDRTELFKEENSKEELWKKSEGIKHWNIIKNILKEEWDNFITGNNDIFWK